MSTPSQFLAEVGATTAGLLERFFGPASGDSIFTTHTDSDGVTVVTAAAYERVGGFGWGGGSGSDARGDEGGGGGGGGGGRNDSRPVAVIRISDGAVEVTPIVDVTRIAVTVAIAGIAVWRALR